MSHMTGMSNSLTLGWDWLTILPTLGSLDTQVVDLEHSSLHNVCKDELFGPRVLRPGGWEVAMSTVTAWDLYDLDFGGGTSLPVITW